MEAKEKRRKVVVSAALAGLLALSLVVYGGGSLEPSAPPGPIMKTLDEVEPRIPIHASDLPLTITEPNSYYLVEDVNFTSTANHAITIECNDVTIDLMGYTLKGPDAGTKSGVYMDGRINVEIHGGTVRDFGGDGIYSTNGNGIRIIGVRAVSNGGSGIELDTTKDSLVKDCTISKNVGSGIDVDRHAIVTGNTVSNNSGSGIYTFLAGCMITSNIVLYNGGHGISTRGSSMIVGNTVIGNQNYGIFFALGGSLVDQNMVSFNNQSGGSYTNMSSCSSCTFGLNHAP